MNDVKNTMTKRRGKVDLRALLRCLAGKLSIYPSNEHIKFLLLFRWKITIILILIVLCCYCSSGISNVPATAQQQATIKPGHYLFFDPQLSVTKTKSCASCHNPRFAFTDGYRQTLGALADIHPRNTPGLINVTSNRFFNWADTSVTSLEHQMEQPLFGHDVLEMGLKKNDTTLISQLAKEDRYATLLAAAWPQEKNIQWKHIKKAIAGYVASLQSYNAPYDRFINGDTNAISYSAKKGRQLFFSKKLNCSQCHVPPGFGADSSLPVNKQFYNIGLYNLPDGQYAHADQGLFNESGKNTDKGKFRVPTLRNLLFTAPYFHDGSAETLEEALQVFEQGGRVITTGAFKGDGRNNPYKEKSLTGYSISNEEKMQLVNFLLSLTDSSILDNPLFRDPFTAKDN